MLAASLAHADDAAFAAPDISIGGKDVSKTHLHFDGVPESAEIVKISTHLTVKEVAPKGLNFFAIQVNFPNNTWAHGGPQFNDGKKEQANWGGLVNRGGGSADYKEVDWSKDLSLIECGIGKPNTVPWSWHTNTEYVLTVERGKQVVLAAGYNEAHKVNAPDRTMWEWKFTIEPVNKDSGEPFSSLIYDSADHIKSFYLWNESGYGSTSAEQDAVWSMPSYRTEGGTEDLKPTGWRRF
jgi:hypothetical protein